MKSINIPGNRVQVSRSDNPKRKYVYTWELIEINPTWVGINTLRTNSIVGEALKSGTIPALIYPSVRSEIRAGSSRIDFLLERDAHRCYVEVKNVTLEENGVALFPDSETKRGLKHLYELMGLRQQGHRAVIFYLIQRGDTRLFKPASHIDPAYASALVDAVDHGVEIMAWQARVSPHEIRIDQPLSVDLTQNL
jgi:sugar fermentation stimulation protein A